MGDRGGAYRVLLGRPEGKRQLGGPTRRWVDYIKMDIQEGRWGAWTRLVRLITGTDGRLL
jgi:hypothetical protein